MSNGPAVAQIGRDVRAAPPCCRLDFRRGADPRSGGLRWRRCQRARGSRHQRGRPCVHPAGGGQHIGRRAGRRQQPYRVGGAHPDRGTGDADPQHLRRCWCWHAHRSSEGSQAAGLRAQRREQHRRCHRPRDVPGGGPLPSRPHAPARGAGVGPGDAVRHEQLRQQPDADRPSHWQARCRDPGGRPVQHVLHAGRKVRDRRRRGSAAAGLPRPAHVRAGEVREGGLQGHRPHRLRRRRQLSDRHLRVRRQAGQARPARKR